MAVGAVMVWLAVIALAIHVTLLHPERHSARKAHWLIIGGGAIFPTVVLAGLLVYGLALMPDLRPELPAGTLRIDVSGEQFWWRVAYRLPDGTHVASANEIRLPRGRPVEFRLTSPDVIHSFWIPALGGKTDMLPGRETRLVVTPTATGVYRGACAEFCGESHANMNFRVVVLEPRDFDRWLEHEARPARRTAGSGLEAFLANGCGACHTIRGTSADGTVGPDLTHVGGRLGLAADALPNETDAFRRWINHPRAIKPGVNMPAFGMLPAGHLDDIARYLSELQ